MFGIGMQELVIIFIIILLLFGARRLPEIGRSMGKALREFKNAGKDIRSSLDDPPENDADGTSSKK